MNIQNIELPRITLHWSEWFAWRQFILDVEIRSNATKVPDKPGVYEVRLMGLEERLTIGKTSSLRKRIIRALVNGRIPHSSGERIREAENLSLIEIRWAETDRPSAIEEELHRQYREKFGILPKYTKKT